MLQYTIKRGIERLTVLCALPRVSSRLRSRDRLVLAYHNIVADDAIPAGEQTLHLKRSQFAAQLDSLSDTHDVVPLADLLSVVRARGARPRAAVTFDDAYVGAVELGIAELRNRGLPATIFVAPGLLGARSLWWDQYASPVMGELPPGFRDHALERLAGNEERISAWAASKRIERYELPRSHGVADECTLAKIVGPGITFGCHSWSHPNLPALSESEVEAELVQSLDWLRVRFANVIPWLSYPFGRYSELVENVAARVGYAGALRIAGGAAGDGRIGAFLWPRMNVPGGLSVDGFKMRVAGFWNG